MMPLLAIATFAGAAGLAIGTIAVTAGPEWRRILRLASGHVEPCVATSWLVERRPTILHGGASCTSASSKSH